MPNESRTSGLGFEAIERYRSQGTRLVQHYSAMRGGNRTNVIFARPPDGKATSEGSRG